MKVLVTGATGFVGTHLCERFLEEGVSFRKAIRNNNVERHEYAAVGDISGETDWSTALENINVIVHLAARVHVMRESTPDPLEAFRMVNVEGTLNLAVQAAAEGVKRFIFLSTIKVNGEGTIANPFQADDQPDPVDAYSVSKMEAEAGLLRIAQDTGMEVVIIRPPLVYGPGAGGNFARLLQLVQKRWYLPLGSIHNKRSLIGIRNLCSLIEVCLTHPAAANRILLASDGDDVSTPQLIELIAKSFGVAARIFPFPVNMLLLLAKIAGKEAELSRLTGSLQIDSSLTRNLLHWSPPLSLERGIRESVAGL